MSGRNSGREKAHRCCLQECAIRRKLGDFIGEGATHPYEPITIDGDSIGNPTHRESFKGGPHANPADDIIAARASGPDRSTGIHSQCGEPAYLETGTQLPIGSVVVKHVVIGDMDPGSTAGSSANQLRTVRQTHDQLTLILIQSLQCISTAQPNRLAVDGHGRQKYKKK